MDIQASAESPKLYGLPAGTRMEWCKDCRCERITLPVETYDKWEGHAEACPPVKENHAR